MIPEIRQNNFFPSFANHVRKWVTENQICIPHKKIDLTNYTWLHKHTRKGHRFGRRQTDLSASRTPTWRSLWKHHHSSWCIFKIRLWLHGIQSNSREHCKSYHRYDDQICVSTNFNDYRQKLNFCFKRVARISWSLGITICHATSKHTETIGVLERKHAAMKLSLKLTPG